MPHAPSPLPRHATLHVALVELYQHHEVVDYLCAALPASCRVHLVISSHVADRLSAPTRSRAVSTEVVDVSARADVIRRRREQLIRHDVCILVTLGLDAGLADAFCALQTSRVLVVHDARFHFAERLEPVATLPAALRRLRYRWRGAWADRLQRHRGWDGFVVGSSHMRAFLTDNGVGAPVLDVAYALAPLPSPPPTNEILSVGVPGTVNLRSRRYEELLQALRVGVDRPVTWVFPSQTTGASAARWLKRFGRAVADQRGHRLDYRAGEGDYLAALRDCDVLLLPLRERMAYAGQYELGGVTKISGTENDQLRVGRPALLRVGYRGREGLRAQQRVYTDGASLAHALATFDAAAFPPLAVDAPDDVAARWTNFLEEVARWGAG